MKLSLLIDNILYWNRKFHIYVGLVLLLFILFYSLSGLLLNHSQLKFASFWNERKVSEKILPVKIPANLDSSALIKHFMKQLNIAGEVNNVKITQESINFRAGKPGINHEIRVDLKKSMIVRKDMVFNWWGKIRTLHTFNGSDKENPDAGPNWRVTRIWRLVADSIAIGLIFLCISSWIMWFEIRKNYPFGLIVLTLGIAVAIFLIYILRIL
jgi:hypothetical protein